MELPDHLQSLTRLHPLGKGGPRRQTGDGEYISLLGNINQKNRNNSVMIHFQTNDPITPDYNHVAYHDVLILRESKPNLNVRSDYSGL